MGDTMENIMGNIMENMEKSNKLVRKNIRDMECTMDGDT